MAKTNSKFSLHETQPGQKAAVIYCRVSNTKQVKEGDGLNSQETRCREFAARKGYKITEVFKDDISGKHAERPAMVAMLSHLRKNRNGGTFVIIDDISRLARGLAAHLELRASIARAGGVLESPSIEFGEDADSVLVENLLASVSQHQRQKNGEQTKNRMRARLMSGYNVFPAPVGYEYKLHKGRGKVLRREEPEASVVCEALEGYASGRFETQADVVRFLQEHPLFPKDRTGLVRQERVRTMLKNCVYAGYVEAPSWGVSRRPGHHEPLISHDTFARIQERIEGIGRAPHRKNLNADFPLRGFVECADCGTPLTACWSTGRNGRHAYYLCPKRGCDVYGKSVKRDLIEGQFAELLHSVRPSQTLFDIACGMFRELWDHKLAQATLQAKVLKAELAKIDGQVSQFVERILDTNVSSVIVAYEERIRRLEDQKLDIQDRLAVKSGPASTFDDALRTALEFLANPWNLWSSNRLEDRRAALKLTFTDRLRYKCKEGFRTASLSLPFNILNGVLGAENGMVRSTVDLQSRNSVQRHDHFVGMADAKLAPHHLVDHVRVGVAGVEEIDTVLEPVALLLHRSEFGLRADELPGIVTPGQNAAGPEYRITREEQQQQE